MPRTEDDSTRSIRSYGTHPPPWGFFVLLGVLFWVVFGVCYAIGDYVG